MPQLERSHLLATARLWEGRCPAPGCSSWFQIEADPGQPMWDVLKAFKAVRPRSKHVHGAYWVVEHRETGGQ
ncbi:MAG: hypothetical protein V3S18_00010 [Dehalococcoidia bacterium]